MESVEKNAIQHLLDVLFSMFFGRIPQVAQSDRRPKWLQVEGLVPDVERVTKVRQHGGHRYHVEQLQKKIEKYREKEVILV